MPASKSRNNKRHVINRADIEEQLFALTEFDVRYGTVKRKSAASENEVTDREKQVKRNPECYLTWPSAEPNVAATTLGPYARWLIAARVLLQQNEGQSLTEVLGVTQVSKVFSTSRQPEKLAISPKSYTTLARHKPWWPVFEALQKKLNRACKSARGCAIEVEEFLSVEVPLCPLDGKVGLHALEWFERWIRWGIGIPRTDIVVDAGLKDEARPRAPELSALTQAVLRLVDNSSEPLQQCRIVNVGTEEFRSTPELFAYDLTMALSQSCRSDRRVQPPIPFVYVKLSPGASRRSVVKRLYQVFGLSLARLDDLDHRPVDLAGDLDPIRRALTVNQVVLIFDEWDNVSGHFRALHEYLCNTHWGEFLRVLAQPHLPSWRKAPAKEVFRLRYCLLVVSRHKATELSPWAHFLWESERATSTVENVEAPDGTAGRGSLAAILDRAMRATPARVAQLEHNVEKYTGDSRNLAWGELLSIMTLRLAAASVNGIRRATLNRCLDHWYRQFWADSVADERWRRPTGTVGKVVKLALRYGLLVEIDEEELESLPARLRPVELERRPRSAVDPVKVLAFGSTQVRSEFVSTLTDSKGEPGTPSKCSWEHVNFLLAEECLRQGTSQLRHLSSDGIASPYAFRRIVQTIYHGLLSLPVAGPLRDTRSRAAWYAPMLPVDRQKRWRYLYSFLYRAVLEGDEWKLGRSFGRPDIRVDLLTLFVRPALGAEMLKKRGTDHSGDLPPPPQVGQIAEALRTDPALWCDLLEAIGRSGFDLGGERGNYCVRWALKALPGGADAAWSNALLPPRGLDTAYYRTATAALKLKVDWLHSKGKVLGAKQLCYQELRRLGVDIAVLVAFEEHLREVVDLTLSDSEEAQRCDGKVVREALKDAFDLLFEALSAGIRLAAQRETASWVLFRLGDVLALEADDAIWSAASSTKGVPRGTRRGGTDTESVHTRQAKDLAYAVAVYAAANRLRADAGGTTGLGVEWPRAAARSMRSYVRTCLRLAYVLNRAKWMEAIGNAWATGAVASAGRTNQESGSRRLDEVTRQLLEDSQTLSGLYTRHHFQFRRERVSMLVLEVDRVRTWVLTDLGRRARRLRCKHAEYLAGGSPGKNGKWPSKRRARIRWVKFLKRTRQFMKERWRMLIACWNILDEADGHLFALGYQAVHLRRPYLERSKTVRALLELALESLQQLPCFIASDVPHETYSREVGRYLELARNLLQVLVQASDQSFFWDATAVAEREKLRQAARVWEATTGNRAVTPSGGNLEAGSLSSARDS